MDQDHDHSILLAKIGLLEILVRMLLKEECSKQPEPLQAMEGLYEQLKQKFEAQAQAQPRETESEIASVAFTENFEMFFDKLRFLLKK